MDTQLAIEIAPFTVANEISETELLASSERLEREFLTMADGYLGRVLVRQNQNKWADIVFWQSAVHASNAMESVASSAACRSYFECMQEADQSDPQNGVLLFHAVKTYGSLQF